MNDLDKELEQILKLVHIGGMSNATNPFGDNIRPAAIEAIKQAFDKHVIREDYKFSSDAEPSNAMKLRNNEHARQRLALWGKGIE